MSYGDYVRHLHLLVEGSNQGARLAYWNMLADRLPPADCRGRLESLEARAIELFRQDKAFFYKAFRIEEVC